jgi:hypothetical protein
MHFLFYNIVATKETLTTSVVWWSEFLATDPEVLGSVPGPNRFYEK